MSPVEEIDSKLLPPLKDKPGKNNWWEKVGGLPSLVKRVAKHLVYERGYTEGHAYGTAISQIRKVCATGRTFGGRTAVKESTKAEYCKAAAEIEAKRVAWKARKVADELTEEDAASLALAASAKLSVLAEELGPEWILGTVVERDFSASARQKAKKKGHAMADGSFPIETTEDLKNAIRAIGRAPEEKRDAVKAHIKRRAKALGAANLLPEDWKVAEEISEEILELSAIVDVFAPANGLSEAFIIPPLSKLRAQVKKNRRIDEQRKSSKSKKDQKRAPKGTREGGRFVREGQSGPAVTGVQSKLGIKTDGVFGSQTERRVRQFQRRHGLLVDGIVGQQTAAALLGNKNAKNVTPGTIRTGQRSRLAKIGRRRSGGGTSAPRALPKPISAPHEDSFSKGRTNRLARNGWDYHDGKWYPPGHRKNKKPNRGR